MPGDVYDLRINECFSSINTNEHEAIHHEIRVRGEEEGRRVLHKGIRLKYCNRAVQLPAFFFTHFLFEMGKKQWVYSTTGSQRCNTNSSKLTGTHRHVSSDFMR